MEAYLEAHAKDASSTGAADDAACTLVELFPGYPGYRGFVAGLVGPGEGACLEQLQRQFPWFDRDLEDRENAAAASRLGLAGGPKEWIWENWLAIEAERGLPITCYVCAAEKIASGEPYQAAPSDASDVRLLVGSFNSNELLFRVAARNDIEMWGLDSLVANDYQLRAVAWTANAGRHITAPGVNRVIPTKEESRLRDVNATRFLVPRNDTSSAWRFNARELDSTFDALAHAVMSPIEGITPFEQVFRIAVAQGGYSPTPAQAAFQDQVFLNGTAFQARTEAQPNQVIANGVSQLFNTVVAEWASEYASGSTLGLGEFIQQNNSLLATY